jgi:hypothetical protein
MGRSITPTYRIEFRLAGSYWTPSGWNVKRDGRPTDERLAQYVADLEASTREGGVNAHLGEQVVLSAKVVRQSSGEIVASYAKPMFSAVAYAEAVS